MDIAFPTENEEEFLKAAEVLGIDELCMVYQELAFLKKVPLLQQKTKINLHGGILCSPNDVIKYKGKVELVFINAAAYPDRIREILEHARPNVLFDLERVSKHDFMHHRASGLNQVHCELMAKNGIALGISFSSIINTKGRERAKIMGRMGQNLRLARKYKLEVLFASFAREPYGLRAKKELESMKSILS